MSKQINKPVKGRKQVKKVEKKPVVESVPAKEPELTILPNVDSKAQRKAKLEAELESRLDSMMKFLYPKYERFVDEKTLPALADFEKVLSFAFDCRNSARKLEKIENPVIIA